MLGAEYVVVSKTCSLCPHRVGRISDKNVFSTFILLDFISTVQSCLFNIVVLTATGNSHKEKWLWNQQIWVWGLAISFTIFPIWANYLIWVSILLSQCPMAASEFLNRKRPEIRIWLEEGPVRLILGLHWQNKHTSFYLGCMFVWDGQMEIMEVPNSLLTDPWHNHY